MKKLKNTLLLVFALAASSAVAQTVWVGGEEMYPQKNIIENAVHSKDHTTLVAAVQAAGLVDVLKGQGPFTVFAPTNAAFNKLPGGTVESLLKPENKNQLTAVLTYHVVPGKMDYKSLMKALKDGKGKAEFKTVNGKTLVAKANGPSNIILVDESGNVANISTYDVYQSNGVIHVIDSVVLPK